MYLCYTEALRDYGGQLTPYEKDEIVSYSNIWYLGLKASKIIGSTGADRNGGYDDDHNSYIKVHCSSLKSK